MTNHTSNMNNTHNTHKKPNTTMLIKHETRFHCYIHSFIHIRLFSVVKKLTKMNSRLFNESTILR